MTTHANQNHVSSCLLLDQSASFLDLNDATTERHSKAQAVIRALIANDNFNELNKETISDALWTIDSLVDEAQAMTQLCWNLYYKKEVKS